MKNFTYIVTDPLGIHARPAGLLVKAATGFKSKITLEKEGKSADCNRILGVMSLGVKTGEKITVTADGEDEDSAVHAMEQFFKENL